MSKVTVRVSGDVRSHEDFEALAAAMDRTGLYPVGPTLDPVVGMIAAMHASQPLVLSEDDPDFRLVSGLERVAHRMGLSVVTTFVGEGERWSEALVPSLGRIVRVAVDGSGEPLVAASEISGAMCAGGHDAVAELLSEARAAVGEGQPSAMTASYELEPIMAISPRR